MSESFMRVAEREKVLAALEAWALDTKASQIGRTWNVTRPETRRLMAEYLLGTPETPGPVGAALDAVGVIVEIAMRRILWNRRDKDIDEIVLSDVETVHVEMMDTRCWWIGVNLKGGGYWAGNFYADSRGRMTFMEQEAEGFVWERDDAHDERAD